MKCCLTCQSCTLTSISNMKATQGFCVNYHNTEKNNSAPRIIKDVLKVCSHYNKLHEKATKIKRAYEIMKKKAEKMVA